MIVLIVLFIGGLLLFALSIHQIIVSRKLIKAGINGVLGALLFFSSIVFLLLLLNIQTYVQLTKEIQLAELEVGQHTQKGIPLVLRMNNQHRIYWITSSEWRIDARFLKWKPWLSVLGKEPVVRLETLSGRMGQYVDKPESVYPLYTNHKIIEEVSIFLTTHMGLVDSLYGSSVYMPAAEGAHYHISASHSGLIARPVNQMGKEAVLNWGR
jgi:hypothetical protein